MAAWRYRFDCYLLDLRAIPDRERGALEKLGITGADFLDAFGSAEDCHGAVGEQAAAVWVKHRDLAGIPPEAQRGLADILLRPTKRVADPVMGCRVRARLYPQSSVDGPSFQLSAATAIPSAATDSYAYPCIPSYSKVVV